MNMVIGTSQGINSDQVYSNRKSTFLKTFFGSAALLAVFMVGCKKDEATDPQLRPTSEATTSTTVSNNPVP